MNSFRRFISISILIFVSLFTANILNGYCQYGPKKIPELHAHPRLFFPAGQESEIHKNAGNNELLAELIRTLRKEADKNLSLPLQKYTSDGKMLSVSREQISRVVTLSMAYRLFNEKKYAEKVEKELLNVCGFPTWSPSHFLDDAEMTTAVAIGYDWCYDYLPEVTRNIIENAILEKAFSQAWPIYETNGKTPFSRENNWNMVCNSGMVTGALAIADKYPDEAERIVNYAVKYTPNLLIAFAPEGVFNEGPGYWSYNGMYMALFFDNLNRILKNDFKLTGFEGLDNTARFYISQVGATNQPFNFGDASENVDYSATYFCLSKLYKQPDVALFYRGLLKSALREYGQKGDFNFPRFFFLSIPWFDDSPDVKVIEHPLSVYHGLTDLLIFNGGSLNDINRLYLAAKTGRGSWSHNHLDGGSFVLDCDGERWGIEIGAESYSLPDFWDYKPGGIRWNYFRNTNQAHSTLSIDNKIQNSDGSGEIVKADPASYSPFGILDLTPYYQDQVISAMRGFRLLEPNVFLIRDEIRFKSKTGRISWRFVTNADVSIDGNMAILSQNGKKFYIRTSDGNHISVFPAKPYTTEEKPIKGVNIIEISQAPTGNSALIPVILSNKKELQENYKDINLELANWK